MADHVIGSILAYLKLDRSDWTAEIDAAQAKAAELGKADPKVTIKTNAVAAIAQLEAVAKATKRLQDAQGAEQLAEQRLLALRDKGITSGTRYTTAEEALAKARRAEAVAVIQLAAAQEAAATAEDKAAASTAKVSSTAKAAEKDMKLLSTAALTVGPALLPIGVVGVAALAGLIPVAGVAMLALHGIENAYTKGAYAGTQFGQEINVVKGEVSKLEQVAASNVLGGLSQGMHGLQSQFPMLQQDTALWSSQLGNIAGHVGPGLLALLTRAAPLFHDVGAGLEQGAAGFEHWAETSPSVSKFIAYAQAELPTVEQTLGNLVTTATHAALAFMPFGSASLVAVKLLSGAINEIPIGTLQQLVPLLAGLKISSSVSAGLGNLAGKLDTTSRVGGFAANALDALGSASIFAVPLVAALTDQFGKQQQAQAAAKQTEDSYTQALIASHGAINQSIRDMAAKNLQQSGIMKDARALGISLGDLTNAVLNQADAQKILNDLNARFPDFTAQTVKASGLSESAYDKLFIAAGNVSNAIKGQQTGLKNGIQDWKDYAAATNQSADATDQMTKVQQALTDQYGLSTQQQQQYAALVGVSASGLQDGTVALDTYASAVATVAQAENTATQSGSAFLQALSTFSQSAGTAADRAALIGATLKAANGDALGYTGAMAGVTEANRQLTTTFQEETKSTVLGIKSFRDTEKAAIDLKTGLIDFNKQGAAPLVQQLQAIQDAAMQAAEATYQHELATKGATTAADDAYKVYVGATKGQLIDEATQLGLTKQQATNLANAYFGMPKDVKTKIEQEGSDPVLNVLNDIDKWLHQIADPNWTAQLDAKDNTPGPIRAAENRLDALDGRVVTVYIDAMQTARYVGATAYGGHTAVPRADGGPVVGPGTKGVDSLHYLLAPGEFVMSNRAVDKFGMGFMQALNAGIMPAVSMPAAAAASVSAPAPAAAPTPAAFPSTLVVVDQDGQLIGRMRVEAQRAIGDLTYESILTGGRP